MLHITKIIALIVTFMIVKGTVAAQQTDSSSNLVLKEIIGQFKKNQFVVVRALNSEKIEGRIKFISADSLGLRKRQKIASVSLAQVDSVWTRTSGTHNGAIIGGGMGAAVGLSIGFALSRDFSVLWNESEPHDERIFIGLAIGAVVGAGMGAAIGSSSNKYELHFARQRSGTARLQGAIPDGSLLKRTRLYLSPDSKGGIALIASLPL